MHAQIITRVHRTNDQISGESLRSLKWLVWEFFPSGPQAIPADLSGSPLWPNCTLVGCRTVVGGI